MGWIKAGRPSLAQAAADNLKGSIHHVEDVDGEDGYLKYPFQAKNTPVEALPFIPPEHVREQNGKTSTRIWIVIDDIVYDCTSFIVEHPGGESVIKNFGGGNCSWQFWRFHAKKDMDAYGLALRIGQTKGIENKYPEPKKFVGLRRIGADDW